METKVTTTTSESYIVILKSESKKLAGASTSSLERRSVSVSEICNCIKEEFNVDVKSSYHHALRGFSTQMNIDQATRLALHPEVQGIHKDVQVFLDKPLPSSSSPLTAKGTVLDASAVRGVKVPRGVSDMRPTLKDLVAGDLPKIKDIEVDVDVYILDTGVDPTHPNLNVVESISMISDPVAAAKPLNGHGTHVAGTIAGTSTLLGVAPRARIHSVRVLDTNGSGMMSWILAGIDLVTQRRRGGGAIGGAGSPLPPSASASASASAPPSSLPSIDSTLDSEGVRGSAASPVLVNLSLGLENGSKGFTLLDQAIENASDAGVIFCVAAGNSGIEAAYCSPAHSPRVITVGAYDSDYHHCYFSNWGDCVDVLAFGQGVLSTWLDGGFCELSGTSMATPHVTGLLALYLSRNPEATDKDVAQLIIRLRENKSTSKTITQTPRNTASKSIVLPSDFRFAGKFSAKGSTSDRTGKEVVRYFTATVS